MTVKTPIERGSDHLTTAKRPVLCNEVKAARGATQVKNGAKVASKWKPRMEAFSDHLTTAKRPVLRNGVTAPRWATTRKVV